jgi:eukaryotic-like serine/threonine-protein kinase
LRATQLPLGREVAIKIVNARDSELAARFVREAAIIRTLEHPNTVRVLDIGTTPEGDPFLVLELLRGQDLDQLLGQQGCVSLEVALDITAQVLKSLAEAHEKGIVHRDIKPGNVFITSHFGEPLFVKVLDFGIAKQLRSGEKLTALGETLGTPSYMAPEQAMGREPAFAHSQPHFHRVLVDRDIDGDAQLAFVKRLEQVAVWAGQLRARNGRVV